MDTAEAYPNTQKCPNTLEISKNKYCSILVQVGRDSLFLALEGVHTFKGSIHDFYG